jgi:ribose transport system ATP-binding protein
MSDNFVLKLQHIRKTFPGVVALDNVHFNLRKGEVHVLLGENGAGKSTLVKIISGAYQKTNGQMSLYGKPVEIRNPKHAQKLGISIIYQEFNLVPHLTAAENIFLGREPVLHKGIINQKKLMQNAQRILNQTGVDIRAGDLVRDLGVAKQQMVEVSKALSIQSRILIMDEPTSALTETEIKELFRTIRALKKKEVSIIYISHRLNELFEIGDRITVLRDGKYIGTRDIQRTDESELIQMMAARELKEHFPKKKAAMGKELLRVSGLCRKRILKNISFHLNQGEVLGISGLLGSGRTELARSIFGADKIDSGEIHIKGQAQKITSPGEAIRLGIGFLTEDRKGQGLVLNLSVKDNICLPSIHRLSRFGIMRTKKETETAAHFCRELNVKTPGLNQKTIYLSGGNQQKIVLSKWLCTQVDIFIFDEPTRGIDIGSKVEIYKLMNRLTQEGAAILMISSEIPEILGMSDRILVMCEGRIAGELSREEADQEKILKYALGA